VLIVLIGLLPSSPCDYPGSRYCIQDVKIIHSLRNSEVRLHKVPHFTFLPKPKGGVIKCNSIRRKKACICVNKHFAIAITNYEGTINLRRYDSHPVRPKVSNVIKPKCRIRYVFPFRKPHFSKAQNLKSF